MSRWWKNAPLGTKWGCLPRKYEFGEVAPLLREHVGDTELGEVIDHREFDRILRERAEAGYDIRGREDVRKIKDQKQVGSCATESTSQAMEVIGVRNQGEWVEYNPWSIYRITSDGVDRGSNIDVNLQFVRDVGVLPVSYFPRYDESGRTVNHWRTVPPDGWEEVAAEHRIDEFFDLTNIDEVGTALLLGWPVVCGWRSHSEVIVDLLPGLKGDTANSWSSDWGDNGFHKEPLRNINFRYGAWAVRTKRVNHVPPAPDHNKHD